MSEKKEVVCQICGKTFKSLFALGIHIRKTEKCDVYEYYTKYITPQKQCLICGKDVPFRGIVKGFPDYCSIACLNRSDYHKEKVKEGVMKKYGVSCVLSDNNIKEKIKNTMIEKYGVDHNSKTQSYKDSYKKTSLLRYGETHPSKSKQIKEKSRYTSLEKYGVEHPWKSNMVLEKRKKTFIEKYGVDNPSKNSNVVNKILAHVKEAFFSRVLNSDILRTRYEPMFLDKVGYVCYTKNNENSITKLVDVCEGEDVRITTCQICGKEFSTNYIAKHIKKEHGIDSETYYTTYVDVTAGKCKTCGKPTKFLSITRGYSDYCSYSCSNSSKEVMEKKKESYIKNYGVNHISQNNDIKNKKIEKSMAKYGTKTPLQNDEIKQKIKNTCLEKYGVEYAAGSEEVIEKRRKTNIEKYGENTPLKVKEIRKKCETTMMERYGVKYPYEIDGIREKTENTNIRKYGVSSPLQNKDIYKKLEQTNLERYGTKHPLQSTIIKQRALQKRTKKFIKDLMHGNRLHGLVEPCFEETEYRTVKETYPWKCLKCGNVFEDKLEFGKIPRCLVCYPYITTGQSAQEIEVFEYVKSIYNGTVEQKNKSILSGKELDVYIPDKKFAIEYDGLYWHGEVNGVTQKDHMYKTKLCEDMGISLIHIYEDEWLQKQDIVKSIIENKLGLTSHKVDARKCKIDTVKTEDAESFLELNHIQGYIRGNHLGLYFESELVAILTYGKPRFDKAYDIELYRYCTKLGCTVRGGLSKLLSILKEKCDTIVTYADLRWGRGEGYLKCGFTYQKTTTPNYSYYIKRDRVYKRYNRMNFQKHMLSEKLELFDPALTEWENMQLNGYDRIWDCGNRVYTWKRE